MVGWSGCTADSQINSTAQSWGSNYGIAAATSVPAYYYPGGSLSFGTCWAFDKTGSLLWTGMGSNVTDTMVQGWIANSGGGSNNPPVANAGPDQNGTEGTLVTLSGAGSTDPDGDPLSYAWSQTGGPTVTIQNANTVTASFTPPAQGASTAYTFQLAVDDGNGGSDSDTVQITVVPGNYAPNASAGPDQGATYSVGVQLDASASSDPDGDPMTFAWTQISGTPVTLSSTTSTTPTFTTPGGNDTLVFEVSVSDGALQDTDRVTIHVNGPGVIPDPPISGSASSGGGGCVSANTFGLGLLALLPLAFVATRRRRQTS